MKKRILCALLALALTTLSACVLLSRDEVTVWRAVSPYYLESGSAIAAENVAADAGLGEIEAAVAAFNSETGESDLLRALPDGVNITGWTLENGELRLKVSAEYASVTGYWRSIADSCMALTFCAIDGVKSVSVYSGDTLLTAAMSPEDVLLTDTVGTE